MELDVLHGNEAAQRLYERLGFRVVADDPPRRRMRLDLEESIIQGESQVGQQAVGEHRR